MPAKSIRALSFSSRRNTSPGPPSPTFTDATNVSSMRFGENGPAKIITRSNLKASVQAYEDLLNTCGTYRAALLTMSKATAAFADAMQRCSGLKGPNYETGTRLQAASGVHHLMGNLWHVLSESLDKGFEKPLRQHLDTYKSTVHERSQDYERALHEKSRIIRDTEMRSMNRKERNLQSFREALAVLQRQVDDLDELKLMHYQKIIEHEEGVWDVVQGKVCLVVRSTMDVFDRFTSKASDPVIEPMLQSVPDPFDAYGPPQAEDQIFSILSPLSISMNVNSTTNSTPTKGLSASSSSAELSRSMSMTPGGVSVSGGITPGRDYVDRKISSWLPGTNGATVHAYSPSEPAEWGGVSSHSLRTASPPSPSSFRRHSVSPPLSPSTRHSASSSSSANRTHSSPPRTRKYSAPALTSRKAENQLRSVLAVLEEDKTRVQSHTNTHHNINSKNNHSQHQHNHQPSSHLRHDISAPSPSSSILDDADLSGTESDRPDLRVDISGNLQSIRNEVDDNGYHHYHQYHSANNNMSGAVVDDDDETPRNSLALPSSSLLFPSGPETSTSSSSTSRNGSATRTPTAPPQLVRSVSTDLGDELKPSSWSDTEL